MVWLKILIVLFGSIEDNDGFCGLVLMDFYKFLIVLFDHIGCPFWFATLMPLIDCQIAQVFGKL